MSAPASSVRPWLAGALLFAAAWWCLDLAVLRAGTPHPLDDLWEDALVARRLLAGDGFTTTMIYPPLWSLRDPATLAVPVLAHGPLLPIVIAGFLRLGLDAAVDGFAWWAAACAVLMVVPLVRVAARRFEPAVGAAAAGIVTVAPLTLNAVHHAASVVVGGMLVLWSFEWAERDRPRPLAAGLALGAGYLVRPELLLALPVVAALVSRGGRGWRAAAVLILAFAACATPWWWHHVLAVGSPLFNVSSYTLIGFWGDRPGGSVLRDFDLTPERWPAALAAAWPTLPAKWVAFFPHAVKHALFAAGGAIGWLAVVGLPAAWRVAGARPAVMASIALALVPILTMTATIYQKLYVETFLGFYALASVLGARALAGRLPWARRPRAWIGALVLLALPSAGPALSTAPREARQTDRLLASERAGLAAAVLPERVDRLLFSDRPSFASWTTGRPAIWVTREELDALSGRDATDARRLGLPPAPDSLDTWFHEGHWGDGHRRHGLRERASGSSPQSTPLQ